MTADPDGAPPGGALTSPGYQIAYHGNRVELVLHPRTADAPAPVAAEIQAALQRTPLRIISRDLAERALAQHGDGTDELRIDAGQVAPPPSDAPCAVIVSRDLMAAYLVPTPQPAAARTTAIATAAPDATQSDASAVGGAEHAGTPTERLVSASLIRELLSSADVNTGLLEDVINSFGEGRVLADICEVAQGIAPVPPSDTTVTHHFETAAHVAPVERDDGTIDYHAAAMQRFVEADALLATVTPGALGTPGTDVYGKAIGVPAMREIAIEKIAGEHTVVRDLQIFAEIAGRPMLNAQDVITILPIFEVRGDLDYGVGNIEFPGDVVILGDVKAGFAITAGGAVIVRGLVEGATITAGGDLTVAGTVGEHRTVFEVGGNLIARYLHTTEATVQGTAQITGEIVNCTITAERVTTGSQGRIVGGSITAHSEIDTGSLGARQGAATYITVTESDPGIAARARRATYPGVVIQIGHARRTITQELPAASFWEAGNTVIALRVTADETAVAAARSAPQDAA